MSSTQHSYMAAEKLTTHTVRPFIRYDFRGKVLYPKFYGSSSSWNLLCCWSL